MTYQLFAILPFTVCLFWTAVLVLEWHTAYPAKRVLAAFMAVSTVLYLCHAVFFSGESGVMPLFDSVYTFCHLAVFPLYYIYVWRLTELRVRWLRVAVLLLPSLLVGVWASVLNAFFPGCDEARELRLAVTKAVFFLLVVPVCFYGFRRLKAFDREVENFYSDTDRRNVKMTRTLMAVLLVCSLCSGVANHVGRDYFFDSAALLALPSLIFSALLFAVGYVGMRQTFSIDELVADMAEGDTCPQEACAATVEADILPPPFGLESTDIQSDTADDASVAALPALASQLDELMTAERLYLQPDLRLSDIAQRMGVGRTTLSQCINQSRGMSFSDYVNTYRIDCAINLLLQDHKVRQMSIIHLCEQCGFTSESSFYRIFRKHTGMTPKQYIQAKLNDLA